MQDEQARPWRGWLRGSGSAPPRSPALIACRNAWPPSRRNGAHAVACAPMLPSSSAAQPTCRRARVGGVAGTGERVKRHRLLPPMARWAVHHGRCHRCREIRRPRHHDGLTGSYPQAGQELWAGGDGTPRSGRSATVTSCRPTSRNIRPARACIPAVLTSITEALGASRTMISSSGAQPSSGKMYVIAVLGAATCSSSCARRPPRWLIPLYAAAGLPAGRAKQ